jgi:hypothetical protein
MIIPNQFLDLYNFGFAPSQNLMQLTQSMVMALPVVINIHHKQVLPVLQVKWLVLAIEYRQYWCLRIF